MSEAAVKQYLQAASLKELDVLEKIIAERREKAEIDAILAERIAKIDSGEAKFYTGEEVDEHLQQHIARARAEKCVAVA